VDSIWIVERECGWIGRRWPVPVAALENIMSFSTAPSRPPAEVIVLGSGSPIRREMLEAVGLVFEVEPARVDEDALKANFEGDTAELATALAKAKAVEVSRRRPDALVIGSDSIVECRGRRFDKPAHIADAAAHLRFFSGQAIELVSAVALARGGEVEWSTADRSVLHVRRLSERFIGQYLEHEWPEVAGCVGVFRMEGRGATLFDVVEGSHFTILGMPLLPLLGALRDRGAMTA
jgi:septum formation protein